MGFMAGKQRKQGLGRYSGGMEQGVNQTTLFWNTEKNIYRKRNIIRFKRRHRLCPQQHLQRVSLCFSFFFSHLKGWVFYIITCFFPPIFFANDIFQFIWFLKSSCVSPTAKISWQIVSSVYRIWKGGIEFPYPRLWTSVVTAMLGPFISLPLFTAR